MPSHVPSRPSLVFALLLAFAVTHADRAVAQPRDAVLRAVVRAEDRRDWAGGELARALSHPDAEVRARAALAVGRVQDSTSVPALAAVLADRDVRVRREAAFALGQVGHRSARTALERALTDRDPEVVALAVEALGKCGDPAATAAVVPFVRRGTTEQRMRACESLWRLADTSATSALLAALPEREAAVRWRVVYALERLMVPDRIVPAVIPVLTDPDPLVRAHAARTLGRLKSRMATAALVEALGDPDPAVVVHAIRSLQLVADGTGSPGARIARLLAHRDPAVRVTAATALADTFAWVGSRTDSVVVITALRAGVLDGDAATRGAAGRALLVRTRRAALDTVRPLFSDSVAYVRSAVVDGLRGMGSDDLEQRPPRVVNAIAGAFQVDGHPLVRMTAAEVAGSLLARLRHPALEPLRESLRRGLGHADLLVVAASAGALAEAGDSVSVPRLAAAYAARATDADADARIAIRDALRALAGRAFADSLERAHPSVVPPAPTDADLLAAPDAKRAIVRTTAGEMEWEFLGADAPGTVRNFARLARRGYFDSLRVHRVVPDFVIQDGDPTGTGSGGPGWTIRCEYNRHRYEAGMVGMALSGKDTGGSQWFVTLSPQPHLNGRYTIFARVTRGLDVARRVVQGETVLGVTVLP